MHTGSETAAPFDRFKLHTVTELFDLPEPDWLIDGILPVGTLAALYGRSGDGKSFVGLDWALSVATGSTWFGRATNEGAVVYVVAEGGRGTRKRVSAWRKHHGWEKDPPAFFVLDAVQVTDERDMRLLAERIAALGVAVKLIVVDTLARCFVGRDENSAQDMGEFVAGIDWLKQVTGAAVVVVHHSGKTKDGKPSDIERGSSALRAAADVMVSVTMDKDRIITVKNSKQKDDEEFETMRLRLEQVEVESTGERTTSCVLVTADKVTPRSPALPRHLRSSLRALASFPDGEASIADWRAKSNAKDRTIHKHREELEATTGYVEARTPKGHYAITPEGLLVLAGTAATATTLQVAIASNAPSNAAATATPL
jgi:RecA/RadA recombinase